MLNSRLKTSDPGNSPGVDTKKPDANFWMQVRQIFNGNYGKAKIPGTDREKMERAHRASHAVFVANSFDDGRVMQTRGNRLCVNSEYLKVKPSGNNIQ